MGQSDSLYKYTRVEYVNSVLNRGIFASPLQSLNDPYESNDIIKPSDYRVISLSRSRNKKLMWSHYAAGHRGCSIKISLPEDYGTNECPLKRVTYTSRYISRSNLSEKEYIDSLFLKDKKWDYELEVRAVYYKDDKLLPYWKRVRDSIFFKATITQIDFGCLSHFDQHYLDALVAIRDYNTNHKNQIKVRKYKMSDKRYCFFIDDSFNYTDEITRLIGGTEA